MGLIFKLSTEVVQTIERIVQSSQGEYTREDVIKEILNRGRYYLDLYLNKGYRFYCAPKDHPEQLEKVCFDFDKYMDKKK